MKRYLLFSGTIYYPLGGWNDFKGSFNEVGDAILAISEQEEIFKWAQVVDSQTGKELYSLANGKWTY